MIFTTNAPVKQIEPKDLAVSFNELVSPDTAAPFSLDLRQRYASNYGEYDFPGSYHGYSIKDIKYKVYVKLQHKDRPDIYLDYVGYLNPELYLCDRSFDEWNNHIFDNNLGVTIPNYKVVSKTICQGAFDSDGDSMKDKDEIFYGMSATKYDDPNADYDQDGLSNAKEIQNGLNPLKANPAGICLLDTSAAVKLWEDKTGSAPNLFPLIVSDTSAMQTGETREVQILLLNGGNPVASETMTAICHNGEVSVEPQHCQLVASDLWAQKFGTSAPKGLTITNGVEMAHGAQKGVVVKYRKYYGRRYKTIYNTIDTACDDGAAIVIK